MINRQLEFNDSFITIFIKVTLQLFAIQLNKAIIFLAFFTKVNKNRIRSQTEINSIIFIKLFNSI